jgi:polyhydroxyalkanoate synthase
VYKVHLLTDTEVTFCLTSGGHNAGIVVPPMPDSAQSYQISTRSASAAYIDSKAWDAATPVVMGSWWPAWEHWLGDFSRERVPAPAIADPALLATLDDAPGRYVVAR